MANKLHHFVLLATTSLSAACGDEGPCLDGGEDGECIGGGTGEVEEMGETGEDKKKTECAPFIGPESATTMTCQGEGTGWLVTDVHGAGNANPLTGCVAYKTDPIPAHPTPDDCASIPLDLIPYDIPTPSACCTDEALDTEIIDKCQEDCGYAACTAAVAAIRASAANLMAPDGLPEAPFKVSKKDLYAYANVLDTPIGLKYCAEQVSAAAGGVTPLDLGVGASKKSLFGHINHATLYLGCSLDPNDPYLPDGGDECSEPTNIPSALAEQQSQGTITAGAVTVVGPGMDAFASITNGTLATREVLNADRSIDFTLTAFEAALPNASAGAFALRELRLSLAAPATGPLVDQTVSFAPGALRFAVTAVVFVDGQALMRGRPMTAVYSNSETATAIRGLDGSFQFVDATVTADEYTATLTTRPSVLRPIP